MDYLNIIYLAITFVISISIHEYAHAWTSDKLGDPTPRNQGRLTPNPLVHIDPVGFLLIFIIQFGRGRPVLVNPSYYKNPLRDELLVAMAGPASNVLLALLGLFIMYMYAFVSGIDIVMIGSSDLVINFWRTFGLLNCGLAIFNLIPIPPLDGYRLISFFFPGAKRYLEQYQMYFGIILMGLIFLPGISNVVGGAIGTASRVLYTVLNMMVANVFL